MTTDHLPPHLPLRKLKCWLGLIAVAFVLYLLHGLAQTRAQVSLVEDTTQFASNKINYLVKHNKMPANATYIRSEADQYKATTQNLIDIAFLGDRIDVGEYEEVTEAWEILKEKGYQLVWAEDGKGYNRGFYPLMFSPRRYLAYTEESELTLTLKSALTTPTPKSQ
jgi:hypothetical protein